MKMKGRMNKKENKSDDVIINLILHILADLFTYSSNDGSLPVIDRTLPYKPQLHGYMTTTTVIHQQNITDNDDDLHDNAIGSRRRCIIM